MILLLDAYVHMLPPCIAFVCSQRGKWLGRVRTRSRELHTAFIAIRRLSYLLLPVSANCESEQGPPSIPPPDISRHPRDKAKQPVETPAHPRSRTPREPTCHLSSRARRRMNIGRRNQRLLRTREPPRSSLIQSPCSNRPSESDLPSSLRLAKVLEGASQARCLSPPISQSRLLWAPRWAIAVLAGGGSPRGWEASYCLRALGRQ